MKMKVSQSQAKRPAQPVQNTNSNRGGAGKTIAKVFGGVILAAALMVGGAVGVKYVIPTVQQPTEATSNKVQNLVIDTSAGAISEASEALADRRVYFAGIQDGAISKSSPILLKNPEANEDIVLQYTIVEEGSDETIFQTDLIESNKAVEWIPGDYLAAGDHTLVFMEQPYYQTADGWLPLTAGNNSVTITIVE